MKIVGVDVGSTTVKAVAVEDDRVLWRDSQRHGTKQAEKVLEFLGRMQKECALCAERDLSFFTGSGAGLIGPLVDSRWHCMQVSSCRSRSNRPGLTIACRPAS